MRVVSDADRYCLTRSGQIVHWNHETNETKTIGESFADCLMRELRALEERKDRVIRGAIPNSVEQGGQPERWLARFLYSKPVTAARLPLTFVLSVTLHVK